MEYKVKGLAKSMTLHKSMQYGLDECLTAIHECMSDLSDKEFIAFPDSYELNIATHIIHCMQQLDDFNGNLQSLRNKKAPFGRHFLEHDERFNLWGSSREEWPKAGDQFPAVKTVLETMEHITSALMENIAEIDEETFISTSVGQWPQLSDMFFRAIYHLNSHIREIWMIRGLLGIKKRWPKQHYA